MHHNNEHEKEEYIWVSGLAVMGMDVVVTVLLLLSSSFYYLHVFHRMIVPLAVSSLF